MKPWKAISFHTDDSWYTEHAERLEQSLKCFNIDYYILPIPRIGSWTDITRFKPHFILECLEEFKCNVVFIDADAIVRQMPVLFDTIDCDVAVHKKDNIEILGGTVYVGYNEGGIRFAHDWVRELENNSLDDQRGLQNTLKSGSYRVTMLPAPYTLIFDLMSHQGPPVIEHFQASRKGRTMRV